jgi:pimeloyl-ACP methyl ester carboxylesterase
VTHAIQHIAIGGKTLEYMQLPTDDPEARTIVFLHEGLGSISLWKDFPHQLAAACGCNALVYSRHGNGHSTPLSEPRLPDYMHREALDALPALLDALSIRDPILFGHSDGASIALIYAGSDLPPPAAVVVCAPHVFVEDITINAIAAAKQAYATTDLPQRLARHHASAEQVFRGWNDIWLHADFRAWRIEEYLPRIRCPVFAIQGYDDEYGTMAQLECIQRHLPATQLLKLTECRHSPHRDQPAAVTAASVDFIRGLGLSW